MSIAPAGPVLVPVGGGRSVMLRPIGDEFYARYETLDGYAVVIDASGGITYATLVDGRYVSTGVPIDREVPAGLPKHLRESNRIRFGSFQERFDRMRPAGDGLETFGPDAGLLRGRKRSVGDIRGLTLVVEFADQALGATVAQVDAMLNEEGYSRFGNLGSVRDYYLAMSSGKLDYRNDVVGPVRLPRERAYYVQQLLFDDAIDAAIAQHGLDLSKYATHLPGEIAPVVDAINFLYAGPSIYQGDLWPHNSRRTRRIDGVYTGLYMLTGLGERASQLRIGTVCHETGHLLCRFPDIYDYGSRDQDHDESEGVGRYCLMGSGNHLGDGGTPAPICGYLRKLAGWVDHEIPLDDGGPYSLEQGKYDTVHIRQTRNPNEYFIVENRGRRGYDSWLPSNGLAVMHCDIYGSNEWQQGSPNRHYQCALLQADGRRDLERNRNRGDTTDLFSPRPGVFLSYDTSPHSREWSGTDSGLVLRDLTGTAQTLEFYVGDGGVEAGVDLEAWPALEIPDDDPTGATSSIVVPDGAPGAFLEVEVAIAHSWRGDLTLRLRAPSGQEVTLRDGGGGGEDDLLQTWTSDDHPALATLTGPSAAGEWSLVVVDTASRDVGTLEFWRIRCA